MARSPIGHNWEARPSLLSVAKRLVEREHFLTGDALARRCVRRVDELLGLHSFDLIVEPSAGDGSFLRLLPPEHRFGIDIEPGAPGIQQGDFLQWGPGAGSPARILTIGNPPFGRRGALAVKFVNHACSFSAAVALILPRSFNKYTFQDRVHPRFHLVSSEICTDSFGVGGGQSRRVNTVFQIWVKGDGERPRSQHEGSHPDFEMRHAHLSRVTPSQLAMLRGHYAFTIPQVGADFSTRDATTVVRGSHWFIMPQVPEVRRRFERLDFAFLDEMNTAHKSLSRRDIVAAYQQVLQAES